MNYCFPKSGEASKPSASYKMYATLRAMCNMRTLFYFLVVSGLFLACVGYYFYLDRLYLVDEVLQGTKLREYALAEKTTVRVLAPRRLDDLSKFVLDISVCQAVHEIQILWPHEQPHPPNKFFKYPHTHAVVTFINTYGASAWDSLYPPEKVSTEGVLLMDADVSLPCSGLAFARTVWRSSRDAPVGFFPRALDWQGSAAKAPKVKLLGWSSVGQQGAYSLMLPAGLFLRNEYLQSMLATKVSASAATAVPVARDKLRSYVNSHAHCADLALPLWVAYVSSRGGEGRLNKFPPSEAQAPIWVDAPGLTLRRGVELSAYPVQAQPPIASIGSERNSAASDAAGAPASAEAHAGSVAAVRLPRSAEQSSACLTDMAALLQLTQEKVPEARFKSTVASSHWIW